MSETEQQKRDRINGAERDHGALVTAVAALTTVEPALVEHPIDAPFILLLADRDKWYAPRGTTPTSVVIHCTAAVNPAASTAAFFASPAPSGSTQAVADDLEGFTMVPDDAVCAGAPPLNQEGLHIEQPGLVTWTRATWLSHDLQLRRVAHHVREWCDRYKIPMTLLHAADLKRLGEKARGITYHAAVTEAFHQSTHTDPGPNYPWDVFMAYVTEEGDDMAILTDDEQYYLRGSMRVFNTFGPPPENAHPKVKEGYTETLQRISGGPSGPGSHEHPIPASRTGKN